jgi:hypothetical protein
MQHWSRKTVKEKDHFVHLGTEGMMILMWAFINQISTGFGSGSMPAHGKHGSKTLVSIKTGYIVTS